MIQVRIVNTNTVLIFIKLKILGSKITVVIDVLCSTEDAEVMYHDATALDLLDAGYAWIVTEQALLPPNTPIGCVLALALPANAFSLSSPLVWNLLSYNYSRFSAVFMCVSYAEARNRYRLDVCLSVRHTLVLYQNG